MKNNVLITWLRSLAGAILTGALLLPAAEMRAQALLEADAGTGNIYEFTPGGGQSIYAYGLDGPTSMAFNSYGDLFVGTAMGIIEIFPNGNQVNFDPAITYAWGLAFDSQGNLYAANGGTSIYEISPGGGQTTYASGLADAFGLAFDSAGNLWAADSGLGSDTGDITKVTPGNVQTPYLSVFDAQGLAFDSQGNIFVTDDNGSSGSYISKITPDAAVTTFASVSGYPRTPIMDSSGDIFVPDGLASIDEITSNGTVSTYITGLDFPEAVLFVPVPEPSSVGLLAAGAIGMLAYRRRKIVNASYPLMLVR